MSNYGEIQLSVIDPSNALKLPDDHYWIATSYLSGGPVTRIITIDNYGDIHETAIGHMGALTSIRVMKNSATPLSSTTIDTIKLTLEKYKCNGSISLFEHQFASFALLLYLQLNEIIMNEINILKKSGHTIYNSLSIMKENIKDNYNNMKIEINDIRDTVNYKTNTIRNLLTYHVEDINKRTNGEYDNLKTQMKEIKEDTVTEYEVNRRNYEEFTKLVRQTVDILSVNTEIIKSMQTQNKIMQEEIVKIKNDSDNLTKKYNYIMNTIIIVIIIYFASCA